jgi:hypothetical protein
MLSFSSFLWGAGVARMLLSTPVAASRTYSCFLDQSNKFYENCMVAATALVMGQTGPDNIAWVPAGQTTSNYGDCEAVLVGWQQGYAIQAIDLLASFDQLGSRCQHGYFMYNNGQTVTGSLSGHAGWVPAIGSSRGHDGAQHAPVRNHSLELK